MQVLQLYTPLSRALLIMKPGPTVRSKLEGATDRFSPSNEFCTVILALVASAEDSELPRHVFQVSLNAGVAHRQHSLIVGTVATQDCVADGE